MTTTYRPTHRRTTARREYAPLVSLVLLVVTMAGVLLGTMGGAAHADAGYTGYDVPAGSPSYRIESPTIAATDNSKPTVTYFKALPNGRAYVELSNGATWDLRPCKVEDSNTCYWDAKVRGNGAGKRLVNMFGRITFVRDIPRH